MKRMFPFLLAAFLTVLPINQLGAAIFVPFLSVQPIQHVNDDGEVVNICTSFSINQKRGLWATAAHCAFPGEYAGGTPITYLLVDEKSDIGVYEANSRPALKLASSGPEIGDEVMIVGYPYGSLDPIVFFGRVSNPHAQVKKGDTVLMLNLLALPGNSGSPILDRSGRFVSIAQRSTMSGAALSSTYDTVKEVLAPYLEPKS